MHSRTERRLLQLAVALACCVPLIAGGAGVLVGPSMAGGSDAPWPADLDSHFRYLSGLLLGLGIAFAFAIPTIERRSALFAALSFIVVVGGLARLAAFFAQGPPGLSHQLALVMELVVVPLLYFWQRRIARLSLQPKALD